MSSRPASPPPIVSWPFFAGAIALFGLAITALIWSGTPIPPVALVVAFACAGGGIVLGVAPWALENERRLRLAEAAVREGADAQLRRLAQTADQLAHVVSRGQSTEEQAGQALGTLEEVAERLVAQAEELASALTRAGEREQAAHAEEIQRLTDERDQKLTALEIRLNASSLALTETQAAIKKASVSTQRAIDGLATRLESVAEELREALAVRPAAPAAPPVATEEPAPVPSEPPVVPAPPAAALETPPPTGDESAPAAPADERQHILDTQPVTAEIDGAGGAAAPAAESAATAEAPAHRPARRPRHHAPAAEKSHAAAVDAPPAEPASEPAPARDTTPHASPVPELALEGMPEPRPVMRLNRREPPGSTSLVATAYIGIGNKLFLRGDGPGLSWERGVPMQFLAIGKWGWTTTDASAPVTCRVYRNDDTPMLEENIVIDPGTKIEVTPRF